MTKFKSKWLRMDDRGIDGAILSDACERFCAAFVANVKTRPLLFISGVSGSGKTHASLGVARFARAAASNVEDIRLIKSCADLAVECAFRRESGVIGHDEDRGGILRAIEFPRIKGGKPFDLDTSWFNQSLADIGQEKGTKVEVAH